MYSERIPSALTIRQVQCSLKARFHYEREKDYSLFVLLIFFALLSARFNFKRGKMNKRNNTLFHAHRGNGPLI